MLKAIPAVGALLVASALVLPTVSHAASPNSAAVSYADLNLGSADGQKSLQRRITSAAGAVCEYGQFQDIARMSIATACRNGAVAGAQPAYEEAVASARRGTVTVLGAATLTVTAQ